MKRTLMALVVLLAATFAYAGGKACEVKSAKSVELNGTLVSGAEQAVFRVADGTSYKVCEKTKAAVLKLGENGGANVHVKGKVVNCGEGEELMIEEAKKI